MTLRRGDHGPAVEALQRALRVAGASLAADGVFGLATYVAVTSYQLAHGLTVDGIAGPHTLAALGIVEAPPPSAPPSLEVPRVRTPAPLADVAHAMAHAWATRFGSPPPGDTLRMTLAHLRFEHGVEPTSLGAAGSLQFKSTYCHNLGNLMTGGKWRGFWFRMSAEEREGGRSVVHHSHWRAFGNLVEGVNGYLSAMVHSFPRMLAAMASGDPHKVAEEGKREFYYSDELEDYYKKLADNYAATTI